MSGNGFDKLFLLKWTRPRANNVLEIMKLNKKLIVLFTISETIIDLDKIISFQMDSSKSIKWLRNYEIKQKINCFIYFQTILSNDL